VVNQPSRPIDDVRFSKTSALESFQAQTTPYLLRGRGNALVRLPARFPHFRSTHVDRGGVARPVTGEHQRSRRPDGVRKGGASQRMTVEERNANMRNLLIHVSVLVCADTAIRLCAGTDRASAREGDVTRLVATNAFGVVRTIDLNGRSI
jgi:hypothetical protein